MRQPGKAKVTRSLHNTLSVVGVSLCIWGSCVLGSTALAGTNASSTGGTNQEPLCFQDSQGLGYVCPPASSTKSNTTTGNRDAEPVAQPTPAQPAVSGLQLWVNELLKALE